MTAYHCSLSSLSVWLLLGSPVFAGAPPLEDFKCLNRSGDRVPTQVNFSQKVFAEVGPFRGSTPRGAGSYVIYINPERTFLGRQTQEWLYLRQCAHISEQHKITSAGQQALNIKDEEMADCWAAREISKSGSSRSLYAIESDMTRLIHDGRWSEVLPGPERRISLSSCVK